MFIAGTMLEYIKFTLVPMAEPVSKYYNMTSTTFVNMSIVIFYALAPIASFMALFLFPRVRLAIILRTAITI